MSPLTATALETAQPNWDADSQVKKLYLIQTADYSLMQYGL